MRKKFLSLSLLVALSLASGHADALGLGQIEVRSRLNQPLVAEIPLLQVAPGDLDRVHVRLASPEAFARVGLDRPNSLTANLQFTVGTNARGEPVVQVTTPSRVNDPFLSFLLEVEWGAGRLVREYNVLLDPPYLAPASTARVDPATSAPAPVQPPAPAAAAPQTPPPAVAQTPTPAAPEPVPQPAPQAAPAPAPPPAPVAAAAAAAPTGAGGSFTVAAGQTLWGIANRERAGDVSVNQMMVALLRTNPDAFIDGNINLLREGAVIRVPPRDEVAAVRVAEANALVVEQIAAWESRRAPVPQPAETTASTSPRAPRAAEPEARLAIVAPTGDATPQGAQSGAAAGGEGTQLRVELTQAEEEIAARDAEIEELRSRLGEVEALAESQTRMIELRNQEFDDLQRQLRESRVAGDEAPAGASARPWYASVLTLGGLALLVIGALVWLFTRRRRESAGPAGGGGRSGSLAASIEAARSKSPMAAGPGVDDDAADDEVDARQAPLDLDDTATTEDPGVGTEDGRWPHEQARDDDRSGTVGRAASIDETDVDEPGFVGADPARDSDPAHESFRDRPAAGAGDDGDDWNLDEVEPGTVATAEAGDLDSVATKLELARAYVDIGDVEGARGMLTEVSEEGTPEQREEARALLDTLR